MIAGFWPRKLASGAVPELNACRPSRKLNRAKMIAWIPLLFSLCSSAWRCAVSNFSRSRVWRSIVLFAASIVFLGLLAHNPIVFLPLIGFLLLGYAGLVLLERGWSRSLAWILAAVVFAYVWLKKYTFLPEASSSILRTSRLGFPTSSSASFICSSKPG